MVKVWNKQELVTTTEWYINHTIDDIAKLAEGQMLVGKKNFMLQPGEYRLELVANDMIQKFRRDSISIPLLIKKIPADKISFSDIELCSSVAPSRKQQPDVYWHTIDASPNPRGMFGSGFPYVFFYVEYYNMLTVFPRDSGIIRYSVIDYAGREASRQDKRVPRLDNFVADAESINISKLNSNTYTLQLSFTDSTNKIYAVKTKKFFVYNPAIDKDSVPNKDKRDIIPGEYLSMDESQLDAEFDIAQYLANNSELAQYKLLQGAESKRRFLAAFWQRRDEDPSTPENEMKGEYLKRVKFVDENFSAGTKKGMKTDRGRIYMLYGAYDEIENNASAGDSNPYEIWHYNNLQGGVIFVFVDKNNLGEYYLVHSTLRGELSDENWFQNYAQKTR